MGRAKVYSHLGGGLYHVAYWRNVAKAKKRLEKIEKQKQEIFEALYGPDGLIQRRDAAELRVLNLRSAFEAKLDDWAACARVGCESEDALKKELVAINKRKQEASAQYAGLLAVISMMKADQQRLNEEIGRLQSLSTDKEYEDREMWCVDYPHSSSGPIPPGTVVGTVESYGAIGMQYGNEDMEMPDPHINILPSYAAEAVYNEARDRPAQTLSGMTTAEACMNTLQFLYVADRNPAVAVGTLIAKNEATNTGTVALYGTTPSSRAPKEFVERTLYGVPIVYQNCHARVFDPGDRVVVRFGGSEYANPVIIGFAENPRQCEMLTLSYSVDGGGYIEGDATQEVAIGRDGEEVIVRLNAPNIAFTGWSDGRPFGQVRRDLAVLTDIAAVAGTVATDAFPATIKLSVRPNAWPGAPEVPYAWFGGFSMAPTGTVVPNPSGWGYTTNSDPWYCGAGVATGTATFTAYHASLTTNLPIGGTSFNSSIFACDAYPENEFREYRWFAANDGVIAAAAVMISASGSAAVSGKTYSVYIEAGQSTVGVAEYDCLVTAVPDCPEFPGMFKPTVDGLVAEYRITIEQFVAEQPPPDQYVKLRHKASGATRDYVFSGVEIDSYNASFFNLIYSLV